MSGSPHERLDAYMEDRRLALGLSWKEVAADARVSEATLRAIRNGSNKPSALTQRGLERALNWEPGSVRVILAGGAPTAYNQRSPMDKAEAILDDSERLAAKIRALDDRGRNAVEALIEALNGPTETPPRDR